MDTRRVVLNWHDERERFHQFLKSEHQVLHVVGNDDTYAGNFHVLATAAAKEFHGADALCLVVDPLNMTTSTPYGFLRTLATALGHDSAVGPYACSAATVAVASNITARRNVEVSDVNVVVNHNHSHSEVEEFETLKTQVLAHPHDNGQLSRTVVLIQQCHEMKMRTRRLFMSTLWTPVLEPLCSKGMKVAFVFCPDRMRFAEGALPAVADSEIVLPSSLHSAVVESEVARVILHNGWEPAEPEAHAAARMMLALSKTSREVYQNLALLGVVRSGAN